MWGSETVREEGEYPVQTARPAEMNSTHPETAPEPENSQQEPEKAVEGEETPEQPELPAEPEALVLSINGAVLDVQWEENETVAELIAYVQNENIMVNTTRYGGFEQVGSLPQRFSRNDAQMITGPGDIVLYSGNQLVLFFGSNSWSYTKLGHIKGMSAEELSELLGADSAIVELKAGYRHWCISGHAGNCIHCAWMLFGTPLDLIVSLSDSKNDCVSILVKR